MEIPLLGNTIELYNTNDGPDEGYCARGHIARVAIEDGWCKIFCSTITERKEKGGVFKELPQNPDPICSASVALVPEPEIDELGVIRFWAFPGTCVRIHTLAHLPLT